MYSAANPHFRTLHPGHAPRRVGAFVAVALHALVLAAVLSYQPARSALMAAAPIMVDWIAQPRTEPRRERLKPQQKPVVQSEPRPIEPAPIVAAASETPAPITAPAPPAAPVAAPEPAPLTIPIFNADYLDNPPPVYPALSRRMSEQGQVVLRVLVNPDGHRRRSASRSQSGSSRLDDAALDAVRALAFRSRASRR